MVADLYIGVPPSSRKTASQREWHTAPKRQWVWGSAHGKAEGSSG